MRKYWITFRLITDITPIEGDFVAELQDNQKFNQEFLKGIKVNARQYVIDTMIKSGQPPSKAGEVILLAVIPLEE